MSLSFCVLGSGSGGNSTLVICGGNPVLQTGIPGSENRGTYLLIDCGLSPRATNKRLSSIPTRGGPGICIDDISAILLTHFDSDHFYPGWRKVIARRTLAGRPLPVHVHKRHRNAAWHAGLTARDVSLFNGSVHLNCDVQANSMLLAHDDVGSVGFVLEHAGLRLGYATDVGRVPPSLLEYFADLDALAIESNYDREMQLSSARPIFLKRRIMGGNGHLSNDQCLEALWQIAGASALSHVALLHLSRQCNDPQIVRRLYAREAPHLLERITITNQFEPTPLLEVRPAKPSKVDGMDAPSRGWQPAAFHARLPSHPQLSLFAE